MAPTAADTAPSAQRQARRPLSRIVPAIPHRLSRSRNIPSSRPLSPPEEPNSGTVSKHEPEPQPVVEQAPKEQLPVPSNAEAPLTPESRISNGDTSEVEAPGLATSPAKSVDDHVEIAGEPTDTNHKSNTNGSTAVAPVADVTEKPATNGVPRKLTVPAELPPPFYPSNKTDRQTPSTDVNGAALLPSHRSQLSAGAVAFHAPNGSASHPQTPQAVDPTEHIHQLSMPRPPPGFSAPENSVLFFPGHSHHPSEAGGPWPYPSYATAHPDAVYENSHDHHSPSLPVGPAEYYPGNHAPRDQVNGVAPLQVEPSGKAPVAKVKSGSIPEEEQRMHPYQDSLASHVSRFEDSSFELAAYLTTQFGNPEFADFVLQIRSPESVHISIPVHGIIVVRSPVVADAVRRSIPAPHRSRDARRMLDIVTSDPFVTREAVEEAIKVLYGAPLLSPQVFLYGLAPYMYDSAQPSDDARMRMRQLLSYIAAGRALQLPSMQARGVDIARSLIRWDTIEAVLQVTLRTSSAFWPKKDGVGTDDPFTAALLNCVVDFIAYTFPVDFKLYAIAPELEDLPRLPSLMEARSSSHNPRLSKIRFGDAPPEDDVHTNHMSRVLSSVLISLPIPLLDRLFNHRATASQIGWTGVVKIMREVIAERENRRKKALRSEIRAAHDGTIPGNLLNNIYVEEHIEQVEESPLHPSGHRLVAQRLTAQA
ncbi:hypothetical protein HBH56_060490 [Parastagonospora nodorum]|uniref:BTB domain-containing protein n=2 Tax=Phaeosphaeria nodorum (strain SN15 / ATCC MYA-4574 / FGSC 10173) TaxID=321614 RepID=A0A7U2HVI7_PHANO|nr:hypothetical protein SNOG_02071 [Parastagonospora nodorum SN15]KAH3916573.1 hypothetical protein HBH56_060490 [Parastagonospora nodorum]EAT90283.1 hypothetical protein SNOG_02071 [Parastagonospora nodorum SN15]KAH3930762.1 hypothetical protein HBH54_104420 [Parastagonospora nodorum]KAH3954246.1 hypothetical protein HBH53_019070 [Parastagonospora nodorum]KAH3968097.1 hypothetical protein HBH51_134390 [Parastagonospora nodorum]